MTDYQKSAKNALEMLSSGRFSLTGWEIENIYPSVKMLLFSICIGDIVCVPKSELSKKTRKTK